MMPSRASVDETCRRISQPCTRYQLFRPHMPIQLTPVSSPLMNAFQTEPCAHPLQTKRPFMQSIPRCAESSTLNLTQLQWPRPPRPQQPYASSQTRPKSPFSPYVSVSYANARARLSLPFPLFPPSHPSSLHRLVMALDSSHSHTDSACI